MAMNIYFHHIFTLSETSRRDKLPAKLQRSDVQRTNNLKVCGPTTHLQHDLLDDFIAYALHRTRLHESVTYASLFLLQRLKARFPAAKGSSGHRLFVSAFMLASKVICDDTYSNKSWCIVAQGMFALREINQMEREMCSYLEWQLNVDKDVLQDFT